MVPGCDDFAMNGDETDVDCGGTECPACVTGDDCLEDSDCVGLVCQDFVCAAPICGDGVINGDDVCDDGNEVDDDACSNACVPNGCDGCTLAFGTPVDSRLVGNPTGGTRFDDACPAGQVLVGLNGQAGGWIVRLQAVCGTPTVDGDVVVVAPGTTLPMRGLNSGTPVSSLCPANHVVRGFTGRSGLLIDQLVMSCVSWSVSPDGEGEFMLTESAPVTAATMGGSGGDPFADVACAAGQVAVGAVIRAGDSVDALALRCATPTLATGTGP